jgi:uncharacterized membrane protein SpoIIM required for sporulation
VKESEFISDNRPNWVEAEKILKKNKPNPESMYKLFVNVSDNLSYARTKYRNRQVRVYLNDLSQSLFVFLYKNRTGNKRAILDFWTRKLPLTIFQCRRELLVSTVIFLLAIAVGVFSAINDPQFAREILGDEYINVTLNNIERGDPMNIYKDENSGGMFFAITINNILVSFRVFIMGIFAGIGTAVMLVFNGIMLGTFQYFFVERGLTWVSFLTIWQHGIIEISSIVIAGGAGMVLGKGVLFPGSFSRSVSFRRSASKAVTIIVGLIPLFIIAGFIESFITRQTDLPDFIRILSLLLSFSLIAGYFYFYPKRVAKMEDKEDDLIEEIASVDTPVNLKRIYSIGQIFSNTLRFVKMNFESIISLSFILAIIYGVFPIILRFIGFDYLSLFTSDSYERLPSHILFTSIIYTVLFSKLYYLVQKSNNNHQGVTFSGFFKKHWYKLLFLSAITHAPNLMISKWKYLIDLLIFIAFIPSTIILIDEKRTVKEALSSGVTMVLSNFGRYIAPVMIFVFLTFLSTGTITGIGALMKTATDWGLEGLADFAPLGRLFIGSFTEGFFSLILTALLFISLVFGWFSICEIENAEELIGRIERIAKTKKYKFDR